MSVTGVTKKRLLEDSFDITPTGLQFCFDRELFLRDEFNVDKFVMRQKKVVSLEVLRDDLMQYFNILKNSLVELINQDYADFVNLSTNLVGLDRVINTIEAPIEKEKRNVENVRNNVLQTLEEINKRKLHLKQLREKREFIHCLENVQRYVNLLEKRLGINAEKIVDGDDSIINVSEIDNPLDKDIGQKLEVIGYEFVQLEYFTAKCMQHPLIGMFKHRIQNITSELQSQLEKYFISSFKNRNCKAVQQSLRTYLTINKVSVAEQLYRDCFVRPELERLISTRKNIEQDLPLFYKAIVEIVDDLLTTLHNILLDDINKYEVVKDFDFLTNSIFSEIINFIVKTMPQIFSPGNPDLFYQRYVISSKFIDEIENRCIDWDQLMHLRESKSYKDFQNKWSIPVYFQIRYQEITNLVDRESCKEEFLVKYSEGYNFPVLSVVYNSIARCWQDGVYLDILRHRFWKLNLQLINFLENYIEGIDWNKLLIYNIDPKQSDEPSKTAKLINIKTTLLIDLYKFMNLKTIDCKSFPTDEGFIWIYQKHLFFTLVDCLSDKDRLHLQETLVDSTNRMIKIISSVITSVQSILFEQCVQSIKMVFDIPRQYRRTNRPWPTTASAYVVSIFKPIFSYLANNSDIEHTGNLKSEIIKTVISNITISYQEQIRDLLNSVKKMEDSLKMFKRARGSNNDQSNADKNAASVSDDDKIRQQVKIDVDEFHLKSSQILGCSIEMIPESKSLTDLICEMCVVPEN